MAGEGGAVAHLVEPELGLADESRRARERHGHHGHPDVDHHPAAGSPDQATQAPSSDSQHQVADRPAGCEGPQPHSQGRRPAPAPQGHGHHHGRRPGHRRPPQSGQEDLGGPPTPRQGGCHGHEEQQGEPHRHGHSFEVGVAHGNPIAPSRLDQQREHGAQQDHEGERSEKQVVGQKGSGTRHR